MHFHFAALDDQGFASMEGTSPDLARALVGGLVQSGDALMAFGNRSRESFLRLRQGKEVPASVTWGHFNRKALVRIPVLARNAEGEPVAPPTVEFRLPDGSVNPFLLLAGAAQSVIHARSNPGIADLLETTRAGAPNGAPGSQTDPSPGAPVSGTRSMDANDAPTPAAGTVTHGDPKAPSTDAEVLPTRGLPRSFPAIADALQRERGTFAADDVFPDELLSAALEQLRKDEVS
jgi:hypothetical protein